MSGHLTASASTQANNQNSTPQQRAVAKPEATTIPDDDFIKKVAQNYLAAYKATPDKAQDTPHKEIMLWLLSNTYDPANMADTDSTKAAYLALKPNSNRQPNLGAPRYLVRDSTTVPAANNAFFIGDLMQIQADNVEIDGWAGSLAVNDAALDSQFAKDFDAIVDRVNAAREIVQLGKVVNHFGGVAHRDAVQIIPSASKGNRYTAAISEGVTINDMAIQSSGGLQGIFATDGAFKNLTLTNNQIQVGGEHALSINGLLDGKIQGNVTNRPIKLLPLRIGGGANLYIIGFREGSEYAYAPLSQIAPNQSNIVDARTQPVAGAKNYTDVDMNKFHQLVSRYGSNYQQLMNALVTQNAATLVP